MKPSKEQETEWFESPTTEYFFSVLDRLIGDVEGELMDQGFDMASPYQLMAERGNLFGIKSGLEGVREVFEYKSFDVWEEIDEEQVRDTSSGRPDID